jgi:2-keto-4-pentenoate hydratase/2-oxohepta-3-ene-1,7-dioic acid hydratase in catechol pathway
MRYCSFQGPGGPQVGLVEGESVRSLPVGDLLAVVCGDAPGAPGAPIPLDSVALNAPFRPGKIVGVGLNFRAHALETGKTPPAEPLLFAKFPSAVTAPGGPVIHPSYTDKLDYEGELAVVIGATARNVSEDRALEHVFGYAVMNDISARDRQGEEPQWVRAKGGDTFAPWGPWVTTADEVPDPQALSIRTRVNGDLRQDGDTGDMVFSVAALIAWCSSSFTLEPGDVITTGTPAGVGQGRKPPEYLVPGDRIRIEIDGLGAIEHDVV